MVAVEACCAVIWKLAEAAAVVAVPVIIPVAVEKARPAGSVPVIWKSWKPPAVGASSTVWPTKRSKVAAS